MADTQVLDPLPVGRVPASIGPEALAPLPKLVYIELADYCNLNCMFCGRGAYIAATGDKGGFIDVESLRKLEEPLRAAQFLGLSGRIGEPLLHPQLEQILQWVYEINPKILLRITTNGTALSRKMANLLGGHLDSLAISLNASNAEAYFREMRPVGQTHLNPAAWWNNFLRRIAEFISALPAPDRDRVRIIAPVQRDNLDDVFDFVRLIANVGCSSAVITPMMVHDDSKIDMSIYWIKDKYNDVVDEAASLAAGLGIAFEAAHFYTHPRLENLDLDSLCREPIESAYLNMERFGGAAPCCHWIEELMPAHIYTDPKAFERFWNNDTYRRLRIKRDSKSCQSCGLGRSFDDIGFHFTPLLKKNLVASKRCAEAEIQSSYPESDLVRVCRSLSLDLRSMRRSLRELNLPFENLDAIRTHGLEALPAIETLCWDAFIKSNRPCAEVKMSLGGCFIGIGWFEPDNDPKARVSARWIGGRRTASVFVRVAPGHPYRLRVLAHHLRSPMMASGLGVKIFGQTLPVQRSALGDNGSTSISAEITEELTSRSDGHLRIEICYDDRYGHEGWVSFSSLEVEKLNPHDNARRAMGDLLSSVHRGIRDTAWTSRAVSRALRRDPIGFISRIPRRLMTLYRKSK
jgi:MoaA/NifB/PqqE/SkfB family radical SAM enzyme